MILSRLDPDVLHPARLAGTHGWAAWGLTDPAADDRHVQLLVPARDQHRVTARILDRIAHDLERPTWPPRPPLTATVAGTQVKAQGNGTAATIEVTSHPWYLPRGAPSPCADVIDAAGWPIVDELTALRDRITAISPSAPKAADLTDLERWIAIKASNGPRHDSPGAPLHDLLARLRRHAPESYAHLTDVLPTAHTRRVTLTSNGQIAGPLGYLAHEMTLRDRARSR